MNTVGSTAAQPRRSSDPLLWGLAAVLTLGSLALPKFLQLQGDQTTELLVVESALALPGAALGCLRRERPWRWAVASFMVIALRDAALIAGSAGLARGGYLAVVTYLIGHSGAYFLQVLPVLGGAILGSAMMGTSRD